MSKLENVATTTITVRDLPVSVLHRLREKAVAEGVKPGDGAVALYALTQFAKELEPVGPRSSGTPAGKGA